MHALVIALLAYSAFAYDPAQTPLKLDIQHIPESDVPKPATTSALNLNARFLHITDLHPDVRNMHSRILCALPFV